jgi:hypothetical protein
MSTLLSWQLVLELAGATYCIGRAADHLACVTVPDQLKEAAFYFRPNPASNR